MINKKLLDYIIERLSNGRRVLISHYLIPKLVLIVKTVNTIDKNTIIYDEKHLLTRTKLVELIRDDVLVSDKTNTPPRNYRVVYIEPTRFPWRIYNRDVLVTLTPGTYSFKIPNYYERIYLNKLGENLYELYIKETLERFRFRIKGYDIVYEEKPGGLIGKAYDMLRKAMQDYGEIRVKDAVNILVFELGISKEKAREILSKLVIEKYIRVEKGFIIVY